jgi:hypothetical protein
MSQRDRESFDLANAAYVLMPPSDQIAVLEAFAQLRYPSAVDRFFEAVHQTIKAIEARRGR